MPSILDELLSSFLSSQRNRPLSVAVTVAGMLLPAFLVLFESDPGLLVAFGFYTVVLLSLAISLPIVLLCFGLWYTPLKALSAAQRRMQGLPPTLPEDLLQALNVEDPFEWPCLLSGGWTANLILYALAAVAYFRPLRVGATFLLVSAILLGLWLLLFAGSIALAVATERYLKRHPVAPPIPSPPG